MELARKGHLQEYLEEKNVGRVALKNINMGRG